MYNLSYSDFFKSMIGIPTPMQRLRDIKRDLERTRESDAYEYKILSQQEGKHIKQLRTLCQLMNEDEHYRDEKLVLNYIMPLAQTRKRMGMVNERINKMGKLEAQVDQVLFSIKSYKVMNNLGIATKSLFPSHSNLSKFLVSIEKMNLFSETITDTLEVNKDDEMEKDLLDLARSIVMKIMLPDLTKPDYQIFKTIINSNDDKPENGPSPMPEKHPAQEISVQNSNGREPTSS
jgi:hypothetical protein